jgi:4-amino-4-deoxy-L-arabinose transferase-like glycosyltransferase
VSATRARSAVVALFERRSFTFWLATIALLGLAIRITQILLFAPWPPEKFDDQLYYSTVANALAEGHGFVRPAELFTGAPLVPTAERAPLYPLVLAIPSVMGITDGDAHRFVSALAGTGTIVVLGLLTRRLAGPLAGVLAAGLAAIYPTLIAADGALMTEALFGLLIASALLAAYRLVDVPNFGRAAVLGVLLGLAALTRGEGLLFLPLLLVPVVRRPSGLRAAAVVAATCVVVIAPWTIRNWTLFDRPILIATEAGETLAGSNCPDVYSGPKIGGWEVECVHVELSGPISTMNEAEEFNEAGRRGIRYASHHLSRVPAVVVARLRRTWSVFMGVPKVEGRGGRVTRLGLWMYAALIPLAVWGLAVLVRRRVRVWILLMPFVTVTVTTVLLYGNLRFRQSAELSLVVLAAVALSTLLEPRVQSSSSPREPAATEVLRAR